MSDHHQFCFIDYGGFLPWSDCFAVKPFVRDSWRWTTCHMPNNCKSLLKIDRQCSNVSCQIWFISFEDGAPFSCNILREMSLYKKKIMKITYDSHKSFTWIANTFCQKKACWSSWNRFVFSGDSGYCLNQAFWYALGIELGSSQWGWGGGWQSSDNYWCGGWTVPGLLVTFVESQ